MVKYEDITQMDEIGKGMRNIRVHSMIIVHFNSGEFGIVYKAKLMNKKRVLTEVAVKTLKGTPKV